MENKAHALLAGLFVLGLGTAILLALFWLGGSHEVMHRYIVVTTQNVSGLNPQAQVKYRGIRVGKVDEIRIDPETPENILIHISVREDVPLTQDTVAKLSYQGITGLAHILLQERDPAPSPRLAVDDEHPPRITMIPSLIEELGESGQGLMLKANQLLGSANALLDEQNRRQFGRTLNNLAALSEELRPTVGQLNATLQQVRRLLSDEHVAQLGTAIRETGPLLTEGRQTLHRLQSAVDRVDALIGDASGDGAAALMPRLNELVGEVAGTARQLNRVLRTLEETPQSLVFGAPPLPPGPGEPGFAGTGGQ